MLDGTTDEILVAADGLAIRRLAAEHTRAVAPDKEGPVRHLRREAGHLIDGTDDQIPALPVLCFALTQIWPLVGQRLDGSDLGETRGRAGDVAGDARHRADRLARAAGETEPPARHRVTLGEPVDRDHSIGNSRVEASE